MAGRKGIESPGWSLTPLRAARGARARALQADDFLVRLVRASHGAVRIERAYAAAPSFNLFSVEAVATLTITRSAPPRAHLVMAVRHPSGALTFHAPRPARGGRAAFRADVGRGAPGPSRGIVGGVLVYFLKVAWRALAGTKPQELAETIEAKWWDRRRRTMGLRRGFVEVTKAGLASGRGLPGATDLAAALAPGRRTLLLLHGILSNAENAFAGLAATAGVNGGFFEQIAGRYDHVLAFNHLTVSRTPEESARELLRALPEGTSVFDVVTHSRGGAVLRNLVERADALGVPGRAFRLGRAVLVASPNEGSPLARPEKLSTFLSLVANLADLFAGPFAFGVEFVADFLGWLLAEAEAIPGVAALAPGSPAVRALQRPPGPPEGAYAALVSNYEPDAGLLARFLDIGADAVFAGANDLVVPTEGGWRVDARPDWIPGERVGCFGQGGNLADLGAGAVHHVTFFRHPRTIDLVCAGLAGSLGAPLLPAPQDIDAVLPEAGALAGAAFRAGAPIRESRHEARASAAIRRAASPAVSFPHPAERDVFHLLVLSAGETGQLLAMYGNACVLEPFPTKGGESGRRMREIISRHEEIRGHLEGRGGPPAAAALQSFGALLFDTLFPGGVRRLYDVARSLPRAGRLDLVLTSMVDWLNDKPWELAWDPERKAAVAVEEINLVRNVFTCVPAETAPPRPGPLRILVAAAQPAGTEKLSAAAEERAMRRGFSSLSEAGLVTIDAVRALTPELLHERVLAGGYDILHFIGHGGFDARRGEGYLVFEDEGGHARRVFSGDLRHLLCHRGLRLVFLNACETGRGGRLNFNRGTAPALVAGGIAAVVANQYTVRDYSATSFARRFYASLAQGATIGDAARESRIAVGYARGAETAASFEWAVPVLFARDPQARLTQPTVLTASRRHTRSPRGPIARGSRARGRGSA
jgi:CHAT domain